MATVADKPVPTTIPASALRPGAKLSKATMAALQAEAQRRGALPTPRPVWDPKDVPKGAYDMRGIRGAGLALYTSRDFETILHGAFETAKTYSCCKYANALLWKYPGAQGVLLRKTYSSLITSAVMTFKRVLGDGSPVKVYGGEKPEFFEYPNGSRLWISGFDNPQKALSGERDFYYINQVEECNLEDWETITSRATGRGAIMPYTRVFGECNPGAPGHWILNRPSVKLLKARHEDNPTLFEYAPESVTETSEEWPERGVDGKPGRWTEQGRRSLAILDNMTGMRYQRGRLGNWVQSEGVVYENFDRDRHTQPQFKVPKAWRRIRVIDFGYENPFVCQWWAIDPDGRMYLYREIYLTHVLVSEIARDIRNLSVDEHFECTICDHDAEDRATLRAEGIQTRSAYKAVSTGIQAVQDRLKIGGDGRPRLVILRGAQDVAPLTYPLVQPDAELSAKKKPYCTAQEFEFYVWAKHADGKPNKEEPVKEFDHGMDATRYAVAYVDNIAKTTNTIKRSSTYTRRYAGFA